MDLTAFFRVVRRREAVVRRREEVGSGLRAEEAESSRCRLAKGRKELLPPRELIGLRLLRALKAERSAKRPSGEEKRQREGRTWDVWRRSRVSCRYWRYG